ncbi:MAG: Eco57I restriction-modification methylase domain-containing protein [Planctomycetes bacterium]|nr:Eco57I restriction-modification methylase domain-containing protein [Planctomycetota bacterium]
MTQDDAQIHASEGTAQFTTTQPDLLAVAEASRISAFGELEAKHRSKFGQFGTPIPVAVLMASMFGELPTEIRLLDAGAGVGSLTAAFVAEALQRSNAPTSIHVSAYEIEPVLAGALAETMDACREACEQAGIRFSSEIIQEDFIEACMLDAQEGAFTGARTRYNCAIQNPPYKKINSKSDHRRLLRGLGIETSNLYSAFVALTIRLLEKEGQLVAITPRSFCNGPYFKPFRRELLSAVSLRRIHVFEARDVAFGEDSVLQENVILYGVRGEAPPAHVTVSASTGTEADALTTRDVPYQEIVPPGEDSFIHVLHDEVSDHVVSRMNELDGTLWTLNLEVSTGRVVDFRSREHLKSDPEPGCAPLLYPGHFSNGFIRWPVTGSKKPNALASTPETQELLFPSGWYVLVKRFSAKEEPRRVVAAVVSPASVGNVPFAVENHVNVYHRKGSGLPEDLAKGLAAFLNSTLLDLFFRQFSGHTQVNATDLRGLKYPNEVQLLALGKSIGDSFPAQDALDESVERALLKMAKKRGSTERIGPDPVKIKRRVEEAQSVLKQLGFPKAQANERSALTLLALLDLKPTQPWKDAGSHLLGITPIMDYMKAHYGKNYAPNSRETVRRQTIHQFLEAALVTQNPDDPTRPTNSGKNVYEIEARALALVRTFGSSSWDAKLKTYLSDVGTLRHRYAQEREMHRIPVKLSDGTEISLSAGGQNPLVAEIINEFCPRFVPGAKIVYVGDTDEKYAHFDVDYLAGLGVNIEQHGKIPDVVVHDVKRNWLLLIEAVTSHGPINPKRHGELEQLFAGSKAGLVFVTTFLDRNTWLKYAKEISWETEVWIAEDATHLIHYNGERFLGPYKRP